MLIFQIVLTAMQLTQTTNKKEKILLSNGKFIRPEEATIKVSKLSHRLGRQGISYYCELRQGRTCLATVDQEANGGSERVNWCNLDHYLLIHHWILNTQKDFYRRYEVDCIEYMVELGHTKLQDSYKEKQELIIKYNLWEKLAKKQPKSFSEARKLQERLGFFDDMIGLWTTVYVENKVNKWGIEA